MNMPAMPILEQHTAGPTDTTPLALTHLVAASSDGAAFQLRVAGLDKATVKAYAEIYANEGKADILLPPIVVFGNASYAGKHGVFFLADGFHRVAAATKAGLTKLPAIIKPGGARDAILYAAGANGRHGLKLTIDDKRNITKVLLKDSEWCTWSDREIARHASVSPQLVAKIRQTIPSARNAVRKTKAGKTVTVTNSRAKAQERIADKQRGQEAIGAEDQDLAELRDATTTLANELHRRVKAFHPVKCKILAALHCAQPIATNVPEGMAFIPRTRLIEICGALDVHPGQMVADDLITGGRAQGYRLTERGCEEIFPCLGVLLHEPAPAAVEPTPDVGAVTPTVTAPAAGDAPPPYLSDIDLAERRRRHVIAVIAERLDKDKVRFKGRTEALLSLALIAGLNPLEGGKSWDDIVTHAWTLLEDDVKEVMAEDLGRTGRHGIWNDCWPDIQTMCQLWGLDYDSLVIIAQRVITE